MFFSFDGIDGVGKSTQVQLFCDDLRRHGYEVVLCRDPGSTPLGERIREILLSGDAAMPIGLRSEMFLYMAARAQLVDEVIRPALADNRVVVADRFLLANAVYQGHAGGLEPEVIWQIGRTATNDLLPDCVFLLDLAPAEAAQRLKRPLDRMECQDEHYRTRLREGFLTEAARSGGRIHVIDAGAPIEAVQERIWRIAAQLLGLAD